MRPVDQIKEIAKTKGSNGTLFGGTLGSLNLHAAAIAYLMESIKTADALTDMVGVVKINVDVWASATAEHLVRCHKDAEVLVCCLVLYWHKDSGTHQKDILERLSDMVFDARSMGTTSSFKIEKLRLIKQDDAERAVQGMSAGRKCFFLTDIASDVKNEGIYVEGQKASQNEDDEARTAKMLLKAFQAAKGTLSNWNLDTMQRYLKVGAKIREPKLMKILERWEYVEKRDALSDSCLPRSQTAFVLDSSRS